MIRTLLFAGAMALAPTVAAAATIDAAPVGAFILETFLAALGVVVAWGVKVLSDKVGVDKDSELRRLFDEAALNGLAFARGQLGDRFDQMDLDWEVEDEAVAEAANYVLDAIPDTLRHFGFGRVGVEKRLRARLRMGAAAALADSDA